MLFFRRGQLSAKKAHALLNELFDQHYQWPLRTPIVNSLTQGDPLRFLYSLRLLVDRIGDGVFLLNRKHPLQRLPWFSDSLEATVAELPLHPDHLAERLATAMHVDDLAAAETEMRRLMLEIIHMASREKDRGHKEGKQPMLSWLSQIADLTTLTEAQNASKDDRANLRRIARRAVRIVWRLPGSRLAALTGSIAAGCADLVSDVDISLFGLKLPAADVRRSLISATSDIPNDIAQLTHKTNAADAFWLQDPSSGERQYLIDVHYFLIEEAERLTDNPLPKTQADIQLLAHLSAADILVDYEFRGPDLLHDLQRATRRAQAERIDGASADLNQALALLEKSIDSPAIFYATVEALLAFFQLLAARNDRWIVFPKWTAAWINSLEYAPADAHQRLSDIVLLPALPENTAVKAATLRALSQETRAL